MGEVDRARNPRDRDPARPEQAGSGSRARPKRLVLTAMAVVFVVAGVLLGWLPDDSDEAVAIDVLAVIAFLTLVYVWCEYDRLEHGRRRWRLFGVLVMACPGPLVTVPVYLCITRGTRGLWATAKAGLLVAVLLGLRLGAAKVTAMLHGRFLP